MRRAKSKIEIAFYEGLRIGISDAINAFYEQNGFTPETFNMCTSMRKEYLKAQNRENQCRSNLYKSMMHNELKQEEH